MKRLVLAVGAILATAGLLSFLALAAVLSAGISARPEPSGLETRLARAARRLLIPGAARSAVNPLPMSDELLAGAMAHFADHCAQCHGNDGRGRTGMGRNLYPRAPDMTRASTQDLSDGELFWIIENGIRLTGMPAWGSPEPEDDAASWELVHFIRYLPSLTAQEIARMRRLNPVSRAELEAERDGRGSGPDSDEPASHGTHTHDSGDGH